jgi:hypothetical protein
MNEKNIVATEENKGLPKEPTPKPVGFIPGTPGGPRGGGGNNDNNKGKWNSEDFLNWRRNFKNPYKK